MRLILILLVSYSLTGCFAKYTYTKTSADECSVEITSTRELQTGEISVVDCDINAGGNGLSSQASKELLRMILQ